MAEKKRYVLSLCRFNLISLITKEEEEEEEERLKPFGPMSWYLTGWPDHPDLNFFFFYI